MLLIKGPKPVSAPVRSIAGDQIKPAFGEVKDNNSARFSFGTDEVAFAILQRKPKARVFSRVFSAEAG